MSDFRIYVRRLVWNLPQTKENIVIKLMKSDVFEVPNGLDPLDPRGNYRISLLIARWGLYPTVESTMDGWIMYLMASWFEEVIRFIYR